MKSAVILSMFVALPSTAFAQTTLIDLDALPTRTVHKVAQLTPLALTRDGDPAVLQLSLDDSAVVPPHATQSGLRLLTVLSGEMSWGDGSKIEIPKETIYGPGSVLTLPAGLDHWLAARNGPVTLQLILLDDETVVPAIKEQM